MHKRVWIIWLKITCVITFLFGIIASAASTKAGSFLWLFIFDLLKWPIDNNPSSFQAETFAVNAVLGGVMVGWAILMYLLVSGPIAKGDYGLSRYLLISLVAWYCIDSIGSILAGLPGNVILNTSFFILFFFPLIGLLNENKNKKLKK